MYDKVGNENTNIDISLKSNVNGYVLSLTPDKDWVNSSDRVFPVTIDPSIETSLDVNSIHDTFVSSNDSSNKWINQYLRTGQTPSIGTTRTYMKFDLPSLTSSDMVVDAELYLFYWSPESSLTTHKINAHNVTQNFDPSNISWNSQPGYDSNITDYYIVSNPNQNHWAQWNITGIAKQWYTTGNNYGVMLEEDSSGGNSVFWSSDVDSTYQALRPQIVFTYVNNTGLEDYWTYHSQDAGRAGTGYINDYNGGLTFIHNDLSMNGSKMPVTIDHIYNNSLVKPWNKVNPWMGRGWNLNIYQRVDKTLIGSNYYWAYTDGDGTKHYFLDSSATELKDELNLGYTFIKDVSGKYFIKDKKGNKVRFYSDGSFDQFIDNNGNAATAVYSKAVNNGIWLITSIVDGANRTTILSYDNNGLLTKITDPSGRSTTFEYDTASYEMLKKITYPDNKVTTYDYDGNYNLTSVTNIDGLKISYEYTTTSPNRVKRVYESNGAKNGQEINIQYENNNTIFTDVKGNKYNYLFDYFGKTISVKDADNSAAYYDYIGDSSDNSNVTKMKNESKLQKTIINYLRNHDFEYDGSWSPNGAGVSYTTGSKYTGGRSLKITSDLDQGENYSAQYVSLTKGATYTLSGYVKTQNITANENAGAAITVSYKDANGTWQYFRKFINGTNDWQRYEVSFTVPTNISYDQIWIAAEVLNSKGTAYFDSVQLEQGSIPNRYNLIEDGDFIFWDNNTWNPIYWTKNAGCTSSDYVANADSTHPQFMNNNVMKLIGGGYSNKGIYQNINVSGKAGDSYVLSGWAKANSAPILGNRLFEMDLGFVKADTTIDWVPVVFNPDISDWQFASGAAVAKQDYVSLQVYISYYQNENTAYSDGIQLNKEIFSQSYEYDSKGNIKSTADLAKQNSKFEYDGNDNLTKLTDPKGNSFNYIYDDKHNIKTATSAENVVYNFTYDDYGNPKTAKIGDDALCIKSSAEYYPSGNYLSSIKDSLGHSQWNKPKIYI